jgi:hypothetical protein
MSHKFVSNNFNKNSKPNFIKKSSNNYSYNEKSTLNNYSNNSNNSNYSNYNYSNLNNIDDFLGHKIKNYEDYEKTHYFLTKYKKTTNYYLAYLIGKTSYLYFTKKIINSYPSNQLYLIEKTHNGFSYKLVNIVGSDELFNGTLIKGVTYRLSNNKYNLDQDTIKNDKVNEKLYFQYEQIIFHFKDIYRENFEFGLNIFVNLLNNFIKLSNLNNNFINLRLPLISDNYNELCNNIHINKYSIRNIIFVNDYKKFSMKYSEEQIIINNTKTLIVKPNIQNDIYELFYLNNNKETFLDYAYIKSYKQSILLNSLFRDIKENRNLDFLEESDSEEEFENVDIDKFVNLDQKLIMKCELNKRFKKWMPIQKIDDYTLNTKNKVYSV